MARRRRIESLPCRICGQGVLQVIYLPRHDLCFRPGCHRRERAQRHKQ